MEAAGLVLGVIPVVIQGLKTYRNILSSIKSARRDLDCLIRDLKTEHQILQNTCEILLKGIVPDSTLESLIKEPFGKGWEAYNDQVRLRLWRSATVFKERFEEMREAAEELERKLEIDRDGKDKTRFSDRSTILKEWKNSAHFTLNKNDYKDILARLKSGNAALSTLSTQSKALEPTRRSGSQAKLAQIIRKLSQEVYSAFRSVLTCSCPHSLGLGMAAVSRKDVILPDDDYGTEISIPLDIMLESGGETQRWNGLRIQKAEEKVRQAMSPTADPPANFSHSRSSRRVRWSSSLTTSTSSSTTCVTQTTIQKQSSSYLSTSSLSISKHLRSDSLPPAITDLCLTLRKGKYNTLATSDCFGDIFCNSRRFNLYHQESHPDDLSAVRLSTILGNPEIRESLNFNYVEQLKLALLLSYSVLHLYKTPWLPKAVTPQDIIIVREQDQPSQNTSPYFGRPFLAKIPPSSAKPSAATIQATQAKGRPRDLTILSLGLLLIQIIIGEQSGDLALNLDMESSSMLSKKEAASKYDVDVIVNGGMNYAKAVHWCLENMFSVAHLDNEKFAQEFYNDVIVRLEDDLELQTPSENEICQ